MSPKKRNTDPTRANQLAHRNSFEENVNGFLNFYRNPDYEIPADNNYQRTLKTVYDSLQIGPGFDAMAKQQPELFSFLNERYDEKQAEEAQIRRLGRAAIKSEPLTQKEKEGREELYRQACESLKAILLDLNPQVSPQHLEYLHI